MTGRNGCACSLVVAAGGDGRRSLCCGRGVALRALVDENYVVRAVRSGLGVPGFLEEDEKGGGGATRIQTDMDIANIVVVVRACVGCVCLDLEGEGKETR